MILQSVRVSQNKFDIEKCISVESSFNSKQFWFESLAYEVYTRLSMLENVTINSYFNIVLGNLDEKFGKII